MARVSIHRRTGRWSSAGSGARSLPRSATVLGVIAFCVAVGFGVVVPVLPVFARGFGVDQLAVGAVISVFAVMRLLTSPFCGRLINRFGERAVLSVGIMIVAGSSAISGLAQTYGQLLVFRGIGGIGSAMFTVSAMTLLLNTVAPNLRGRATGFFQGGFLIGGMTGPAIGGLLSQISLTAPFFFYAGALAAAGVVGRVLLPRGRADRDPGAGSASVARPFRAVLADSRYQAACLANLAQGWTSFGVRSSLIPVLVVEVLHREPSWTGISFAIAAVVQTIMLIPAGRMVDTVGRRPALIIGGVLCGVSISAVAFAPSITILIMILAVYGMGAAFLGTAPAAAVGDAAGGRTGTPVAVFSMCSDIGAILGPLVAGWLADHASYPIAFGVGAVLLLAGAALGLRMPGGVPPATPPPTPPSNEAETAR